MRRTWINLLLDVASAITVLAMTLTGLIMRYTLPPGTAGLFGRGGGMRLWGLTRHDWGAIHFWTAAVLGGLLVVHVALHWAWISGMLARIVTGKGQTRPMVRNTVGLLGLAALVGLIAGFMYLARSMTTGQPGRHLGQQRAAGQLDNPDEANPKPRDRGHRQRDEVPGPRPSEKPARSQPAVEAGDEPSGDSSGDLTYLGRKTLADVQQITGVKTEALLQALSLPANLPPNTPMRELTDRTGLTMQQIRQIINKLRAQTPHDAAAPAVGGA